MLSVAAPVQLPEIVPGQVIGEPFTDGKKEFRNYKFCYKRVSDTYHEMHSIQCVDFVKEKIKQWCQFSRDRMTIMEALEKLSNVVDSSDPDVNDPNFTHAFQTAESIRSVHPDKPWFQLTGLIHDLGKLLAYWGEPQSAVVGDTFPVGCAFVESNVFGVESFANNIDTYNPAYNTRLGMYEENCGLRNVLMSWGHDEYLYRVLKNHSACSLPEEALDVIRFHSFYPWHTYGDYMHLCNEQDLVTLGLVKEFNKYDLYSKGHDKPDIDSLIPYYQELIDEHIPGPICW